MQRKLFITGASGFLGWNLCRIASAEGYYQVIGGYLKNKLNRDSIHEIKIDITHEKGVKELFAEIKPNAVIHLAAFSDPNECQANHAGSYRINVKSSVLLGKLCADISIPYIFASTDLVFDGRHPPYSETDSPNPINVYAEHKLIAENWILEEYPGATICRLPWMYGYSLESKPTFLTQMITCILNNQPMKLFLDEFRTPVDAESASKGLLLCLNKNLKGVYHLGGTERFSRFELGKSLERMLNRQHSNMISILQKDNPMAAPRPKDVSLDSSKAFAAGYAPLKLQSALEKILKHYNGIK